MTAREPRRRSAVAALIASFAVALATTSTTSASFTPGLTMIALRPVATGFDSPLFVTGAGDGSRRLFVVEQTGRIWIVRDGSVVPTPFLDIRSAVSCCGERGLLGLAFHPSFATNRKVYVSFTDANGNSAVNEYRTTTNPDRLDTSTARRVLAVAQPYANHNGGMVAFGPDHYLYVAMGDGGSSGDPGNRAQNVNTLLGKLLRIDVNRRTGTLAYGIPPSNPFVGRTGRDEIWAYGLRNPWRLSFDALNGNLWIGDVGQGSWEEIDRSTRASGGGRGANYGWRVMEGRHCFNPSSGCSQTGKVLPIVEYSHSQGCSVTGGYVYRGVVQPSLHNAYFFGDYCSGRIWAIRADAGSPATPTLMLDTSLNVSSFGQDDGGEVYVVDHSGGTIYRIIARRRPNLP